MALVLGTAACSKSKSEPAAAAEAARKLPPPLASAAFYRIDAGPQTPCKSGEPCEARLVVTALGDFHVNKDYPFKFVAEAAPGVTVDGTGAFALDDAKTGTLTIRYRCGQPGKAALRGVFKLSVCTDEECKIEQPTVELALPVT